MVEIFPDADEMGAMPLIFMMIVYGYILLNASKTISDGCEMLLLLYGPGLIGGLLIPILGAVPDCIMILMSGIKSGTAEEIQNQVTVGVGTLVGSTIMVITIPWGIGIFLGRRDYDPKTQQAGVTASNKPLYTKFSFTENCVTTLPDIPGTAKIMMLAAINYLIVQVPVFVTGDPSKSRSATLACMIISLIGFVSYCIYQYKSAAEEERDRRKQEHLRFSEWKKTLSHKLHSDEYQESIFKKFDTDKSGFMDASELASALSSLGLKVSRRDATFLLSTIDVGDGNGHGARDGKISLPEFKAAVTLWVTAGQKHEELNRLQEAITGSRTNSPNIHQPLHRRVSQYSLAEKILASKRESGIAGAGLARGGSEVAINVGPDTPAADKNKKLNYGSLATIDEKKDLIGGGHKHSSSTSSLGYEDDIETEEDCDEEEEEEFWELSESQLKIKALLLLIFGTCAILIFSDPMVDVLAAVGKELDVSPFYVSFVVTPVASNASEVIAGLLFARKKTNASISLSLSSLHGAATMNATLSLAVFTALVYFRELKWSFSAEVIVVLVVTFIVGINGLRRNIYVWQGALVASLYPLSILFVYIAESVFGMD